MAFGFRPIGMLSGEDNIQVTEYDITAGAAAIYAGDPVKQLTDGSIVVAAAGDLIIGTFAGCKYFNAKGEYVTSPNYDAPTTPTNIKALVFSNPDTIFEVLSDADVTAANIGALYDFVYAAGSTVNGVSAVTLGISTLGLTDKAFRITGLSDRIGDNARIVKGIFIEHTLRGVVAGVGGI